MPCIERYTDEPKYPPAPRGHTLYFTSDYSVPPIEMLAMTEFFRIFATSGNSIQNNYRPAIISKDRIVSNIGGVRRGAKSRLEVHIRIGEEEKIK